MMARTTLPAGCVPTSYKPEDVSLLLSDLSGRIEETALSEREARMQGGGHYSEMLPVEYEPSIGYQNLFHAILTSTSAEIARTIAVLCERVIARRDPTQLVLVSLARAGTPAGILMVRYLRRLGFDVPHYSVSIIRDRGIDELALRHIVRSHPAFEVQFVDGWTGKGTIARELSLACDRTNHLSDLDPTLAVIADPGRCTPLFGTRSDLLVPSACLNATVSGLVSRTVYRPDLTADSFHGAKYYGELASVDVSNLFLDVVQAAFPDRSEALAEANAIEATQPSAEWTGGVEVESIAAHFGIQDVNLVKPGIGETLRVLLRRKPWRVLVRDAADPALEPIFALANEKNVPIELFPEMSYKCCGLIEPMFRADV